MQSIRWKQKDPLGRTVILKESTFREHIESDHSPADAKYRTELERAAQSVLKEPRFIVMDSKNHGRDNYLDLAKAPAEDGSVMIKPMKVVVDKQREPHEVVTWIVQRKLSEIAKEGIVYEPVSR